MNLVYQKKINFLILLCSGPDVFGKIYVSILYKDLGLMSHLGKVTFNQQVFLSLPPSGKYFLKILDSYISFQSLLDVGDLVEVA